jgi:hypothetical protein
MVVSFMIVAPFTWRPCGRPHPHYEQHRPDPTPSRISLKKFRRDADLHPDGRALIRHWPERAFVTPRNGSFESFIHLRRGRRFPLAPIHYEGWKNFQQGRDEIEREFARAPEDIRRRIRWLPVGVEVEIAATTR